MNWDVEYTNEFGAWWTDLMEAEQEDVAAAVELLMEQGPRLSFPHSRESKGPATVTCASCGSRVAGNRFVFSMLSIRDDR